MGSSLRNRLAAMRPKKKALPKRTYERAVKPFDGLKGVPIAFDSLFPRFC